MVETFPGRILYCDGAQLFRSKGSSLWMSNDSGANWHRSGKLPINCAKDLTTTFPTLARAFRSGFHHLLPGTDNSLFVVANKSYYLKDKNSSVFKEIAQIVGSRPLVICKINNQIYYGEYRSNRERSTVSIWTSEFGDCVNWSPAWTFDNVRHIHAVAVDPYTGSIWVTTGDTDNESAIWVSEDNFQTLAKVLGGSQQTRVVQLLFTESSVFFASDAPNDVNHIFSLDKNSGKLTKHTEIGGPVFYGCAVRNSLFFSTVVEPSDTNNTKSVELWRSDDGEHWYTALELKKDVLPMKLFQYGQINFPGGPGDNENLWISPMSTINGGNSYKINVSMTKGATDLTLR